MKLQRRLASSEVMAICAVFHLSGYRTFKWFYQKLVLKNYHKFFPNIVSYNHFVELMPYTALPMVFFAHPRCGEYTICTNFSGIPINQGLSASQTVQNIAKTL